MRKRQDIFGDMHAWNLGPAERLIVELLLDIRDSLARDNRRDRERRQKGKPRGPRKTGYAQDTSTSQSTNVVRTEPLAPRYSDRRH